MNPHQKNKIDVSSLSPEEQRLFRLYGKLPSRSDHFAKHLKERKYFDSGDYAMSKAGKGDGVDTGSVGSQHPVPENIPHLSSPVNSSSTGASASSPGSAGIGGGAGGGTLGGPNTVPSLHPGSLHHHGSMQAGSPVKESSFLHRETSADEVDDDDDDSGGKTGGVRGGQQQQTSGGIPIRR